MVVVVLRLLAPWPAPLAADLNIPHPPLAAAPRQVCYACVEEGEFKLAQLCGLNIIINADDLMEVRPAHRVLEGLAGLVLWAGGPFELEQELGALRV